VQALTQALNGRETKAQKVQGNTRVIVVSIKIIFNLVIIYNMNKQYQEQWLRYTAAWKAKTEVEKRALFEQCLSPDCTYRDPLVVAQGWNALVTYMLEFHKTIPGGHFVTREFKSHNSRSIAEWTMCAGDGSELGVGISYGEYNAEGQLTSMTGFFDSPEEQ